MVRDQISGEAMTLEQFIEKLLGAYEAFATSEADQPSACLCLTLDHWERFREQYGYSGLIDLVGKVKAMMLAESDVEILACALNERCVLALLPQCSLKTAEKQTDKLFRLVGEDTFAIGEETVALSVSVCFTEFDHRFTSADQLLLNLIKSTEQISASGGNVVKRIRPNVSAGQASASDQQMLGLLMESLRKDAVKVLFQPLMATAGEPSKSFQMLPRITASDGSLISAAQFVPVARQARVLGVLDRWMIQRAIHLLVNDYHLQPLRLFLSQGESLLVNPERRDWLRRLVEKHPGVSGKLVLDFALEDALANLKSAAELLALADELGIEVCLSRVDEHSKWDLLSDRLRVDYIKMSPEFVQRLGQEDKLERVFQDASAPVREQGTRVIMPMVEDAAAAANLWRTGADYMQGYMIEREVETLELGD